MGTYDVNRADLRVQYIRTENARAAEDLLRGEIHAWASWKHDPARFEADMLAVYGLAPLDEPTVDDESEPTPEPEPATETETGPIEHGTTRGVQRHRNLHEELCDRCWGVVKAARAADRRAGATS